MMSSSLSCKLRVRIWSGGILYLQHAACDHSCILLCGFLACRVPETVELRFGIVKLQTVAGDIFIADVQHNS